MAESELHVLRARLEGGIKNKAARGELRRGLPVGLIWGEADGEIRFHPDEAVTGVLAAVFGQFAVSGSVRATWLWLRAQGLRWPLQQAVYLHGKPGEITWVEPTYHAVHTTLTHPAYAGAYAYGRTRDEHCLGQDGALRKRRRKLPRDQWEVLIPDHHPGFIDWDTYLANQARIGSNTRPQASRPGTGAVREGSALLQGLATCGSCGRKKDTIDLIRRLAVHYPNAVIAGILNRQHRTTARGMSYTANRVGSLRTHWGIPRHQPSPAAPREGELLNVTQAARQLQIAPSTLLRWLNDGFIAGEQVTPGAPWRIRLTEELRGMLTDNAPDGWLALHHASRALDVSRQTVLQKVKRGELRAVLTRTGRRKGLRIEIPTPQEGLF